MKKFAFFSTLSNQLNIHTAMGANLREIYNASYQLLTSQSLSVLDSCLLEAKNNFKGEKASVALARDYLEDAVTIADVLLENDEKNGVLNSDGKKLLSKVYGEYADFLRQTTSSTCYDTVRKYVDKSLMLDPANQLAKETDAELSYNFKT